MNSDFKFCEHCGEKIGAHAAICPKCGYACSDAQGYRQANYSSQEDRPSGGMNALAFFIPLAGIILYFISKNETPIKAKSMLKFAIIGICVGVGISILCNVIQYAVAVSTANSITNSINRAFSY